MSEVGPLKVMWLRDDEELLEGEGVTFTNVKDTFTLKITEVDIDDEGEYKLILSNPEGKIECVCDVFVNDAKDEVFVPPILIMEKAKAVVMKAGKPISFSVLLNQTADKVEWYLRDKLVEESPKYEFSEEENKYTFVIKKGTISDKGAVKFVATNAAGSVSCSAKLTVQPADPEMIEKADIEQEVVAGKDIILAVELEGHPNPKVEWFKGFKKLLNVSGKTEISVEGSVYTLLLKNAKLDADGQYRCVASSSSGKSEKKFTVHMKGVKMCIYV